MGRGKLILSVLGAIVVILFGIKFSSGGCLILTSPARSAVDAGKPVVLTTLLWERSSQPSGKQPAAASNVTPASTDQSQKHVGLDETDKA